MAPMHCLSITTAALLLHALLVPTCVRWNIGANIREATERHIGINPGEAYDIACPEGTITVARELSYEEDTPLIAVALEFPTAQNIHMGEHYRRVTIRRNKLFGPRSDVGERYELAELPQTRNRLSQGNVSLNPRSMGSAEVERSATHPWAVAAAVPFDYLIDPALSAVSSAAVTPFFGIGILYNYCYFSLKKLF